VERPDVLQEIDSWRRAPFGFDMTTAWPRAVNSLRNLALGRKDLLSEPLTILELALGGTPTGLIAGEAVAVIERPGMVQGVGGWFQAQLSDHFAMTNSPVAAGAIRRNQVMLPIERGVGVSEGDRVSISLRIRPEANIVAWGVEIGDASGRVRARFRQSNLGDHLLSSEDLRSTRPDSVPTLSRWGAAEQSVLELCDGRRRVLEIEETVGRRFDTLFSSKEEVSRFVASVLMRSCA